MGRLDSIFLGIIVHSEECKEVVFPRFLAYAKNVQASKVGLGNGYFRPFGQVHVAADMGARSVG